MPKLPTLTKDSTIADVRGALVEGAKTLIELRATPHDKRGETFAADIKETADFLHDADLIEKSLEAGERQRRDDEERQRREDEDKRNKGLGGRSLGVDPDGNEIRTLGYQVTGADGFEDWQGAGRRGPFVVETRNLIGGFTAGAYDSGAHEGLPVGSPVMVPGSMQRRRAFVRDLMSTQGTGLRVVPYFRELNAVINETGAQMTSEGSSKAEVTMEFEAYNAVVEKITAWIPVTDEILSDAPTLRGYIDTRLEYMLMIREEQQVLAGSGTTPQLEGLATVQGTQTETAASGDYPVAIANAIAKVENVDGEADGAVGNPLDYWKAVATRYEEQFDNGFGGNAPSAASGITWGLPTVRTRAMTSGSVWVGSWRLGSTLFDRQQTTLKVGDQHSDYFVRNLLVILAEKRIAVAWHRPNLFVDTTVPAAA